MALKRVLCECSEQQGSIRLCIFEQFTRSRVGVSAKGPYHIMKDALGCCPTAQK
jgi:hypothetical protein